MAPSNSLLHPRRRSASSSACAFPAGPRRRKLPSTIKLRPSRSQARISHSIVSGHLATPSACNSTWARASSPPTANTTGNASGRMAVFYGPLLLAYDSRFGRYSPSALPVIDRTATTSSEPSAAGIWNPLLLLTLLATDGSTITLCDFASAGAVPWIPTRRWRFSRKDGTLLAPQLALLPDGTIQG